MGAKTGKMYTVKYGRPMWAYGPHIIPNTDDFILVSVPDRAMVMFIEEIRNESQNLEYVKVIYGEHVGYLQWTGLAVGALLAPVTEVPAPSHRSDQDRWSVSP